jgi:hypothetical protein
VRQALFAGSCAGCIAAGTVRGGDVTGGNKLMVA